MMDAPDLVAEGFVCSTCGEPFHDGSGRPRDCRACDAHDESRHDELAQP